MNTTVSETTAQKVVSPILVKLRTKFQGYACYPLLVVRSTLLNLKSVLNM